MLRLRGFWVACVGVSIIGLVCYCYPCSCIVLLACGVLFVRFASLAFCSMFRSALFSMARRVFACFVFWMVSGGCVRATKSIQCRIYSIYK